MAAAVLAAAAATAFGAVKKNSQGDTGAGSEQGGQIDSSSVSVEIGDEETKTETGAKAKAEAAARAKAAQAKANAQAKAAKVAGTLGKKSVGAAMGSIKGVGGEGAKPKHDAMAEMGGKSSNNTSVEDIGDHELIASVGARLARVRASAGCSMRFEAVHTHTPARTHGRFRTTTR